MSHQSGCGCQECADAVRGNPGAPGKSKYLYIAYASDNAGSDFSLIPNDNLEWIQFLVLDSSATTLTIANFTGTWVKFIGNYGGNSDDFIFDASLAGDPGSTKLAFNNANISAATEINVSVNDASSLDVTNWLTQLSNSTSTIKALLRVFKNDASKAFFRVTSVTNNTTYFTIGVTFIVATNNSPFAADDKVVLTFSNTGDKGDDGNAGGAVVYNYQTPPVAFTSVGLTTIDTQNVTLDTDGSYIEVENFGIVTIGSPNNHHKITIGGIVVWDNLPATGGIYAQQAKIRVTRVSSVLIRYERWIKIMGTFYLPIIDLYYMNPSTDGVANMNTNPLTVLLQWGGIGTSYNLTITKFVA